MTDWLYYPKNEIIIFSSHCFLLHNIAGSEDRISADGGVIAGPPTPCPGGSGGLAGSSTLSSSALSIDSGGSTSTISASGASGLPSSSTLMTNGDGGTQSVGGGSGSHGHHGGGTSGLNGSLMSSIAGLANGKHHHNGDLNHLAATKLASLGTETVEFSLKNARMMFGSIEGFY